MEGVYKNRKAYTNMIKESNILTTHEFGMSMTDSNGTFVKLKEINEMLSEGVLTVDYDKLEQRVYHKTMMK